MASSAAVVEALKGHEPPMDCAPVLETGGGARLAPPRLTSLGPKHPMLGTDDEEQARRTEVVLRELVGAECGSNFIPRESQLRKPRLWWGAEPPGPSDG